MSASLSVSVVTYRPDTPLIEETLSTLAAALSQAQGAGTLARASVLIVDNGPGDRYARLLEEQLGRKFAGSPIRTQVLSGHGNIGYGRGHNLALLSSDCEFHLVLNPDVALAADAIAEALRFMAANPQVAILAPLAFSASGERLFLCKRYPSVLDLLLRGFAPAFVKRLFSDRLARYEMRDLPGDRPSKDIPIVSGSFMFCRRAPVAAVGGFSDAFFLYFEDFDLSLRAANRGELAWVPTVRIVHRGGDAARKGLRHVLLFARSAVAFFNRHGWKWA